MKKGDVIEKTPSPASALVQHGTQNTNLRVKDVPSTAFFGYNPIGIFWQHRLFG